MVVSDGKGMIAGPEESGDEAAMLARWVPDVPVVVGKDRYASGMMAFRRFGPDCFLLDDGFQHRRLFRDRDIVVINARDPFGSGNLLPLGRLREPATALGRASLILVNKSIPGRPNDPIIERIRCYNNQAPVFETTYEPEALVAADAREAPMPLSQLQERPVLAFAGIADPCAFFGQLEALGARIVCRRVFPDHHWFSPGEIARMREQARMYRAECLVTTEKDGIRIPAEWRGEIFLLIMKMGLKNIRGQGILSILVQGAFS
jgi:tetraacyldisaccharide 4'-kinase